MPVSSTQSTQADALATWVHGLLGEYAQKTLSPPLDSRLSLRDDLAIESLSLVSLVVRLGDELGVDAADDALELEGLTTVGDLLAMARRLELRARAMQKESGERAQW
jgi:acyl carrier protein